MEDSDKFLLGLIAILSLVAVFVLAAEVGETRASAMKECYKAAQVNPKVTCEASHD